MTFLLFLVSVAVMEYLVRDIGRKSPGQYLPPDIRNAAEPGPLANETPTAELLALADWFRARGCSHVVTESRA